MEIEWVHIPSGSFMMGTPHDEVAERIQRYSLQNFSLENPQAEVYIDGYDISKYPITNQQYREFVDNSGYVSISPLLAQYARQDDQALAHHPVAWISWFDALAFCQWATCRLPSEAEWEKAARGPDAYRFPWGNHWELGRCNSIEEGNGTTTPVDSYARGASPYGVHDMAGNVWEWTCGWVTTHCLSPKFPGLPGELEEHIFPGQHLPILRGGSLGVGQEFVRSAYRYVRYDPRGRYDWVGFRCVKLESGW